MPLAAPGVKRSPGPCLALAISIGLVAPNASAQTDEIQVYNAEIAAPGVVNLTLHDNYTFSGSKTARFPGGLVPDHTLNGVPEWALGVTDWFEQGLYLPLYSDVSNRGATLNGFKIRELFVVPDAANEPFFYGINFEFSYNAKHWDPNRYSSEITPIIGWHLGSVDLIVNPIFDNSFKGFKNLDFAPEGRVAYNFSTKWAAAVENYSDFGVVNHFLPGNQQFQQLFGVLDYTGAPFDIEAGLGFGVTAASDGLVAKLILSRDLNWTTLCGHLLDLSQIRSGALLITALRDLSSAGSQIHDSYQEPCICVQLAGP